MKNSNSIVHSEIIQSLYNSNLYSLVLVVVSCWTDPPNDTHEQTFDLQIVNELS